MLIVSPGAKDNASVAFVPTEPSRITVTLVTNSRDGRCVMTVTLPATLASKKNSAGEDVSVSASVPAARLRATLKFVVAERTTVALRLPKPRCVVTVVALVPRLGWTHREGRGRKGQKGSGKVLVGSDQ